MSGSNYIAFFIVMLVFIVITIINNRSAITETINGDTGKNVKSIANGNNKTKTTKTQFHNNKTTNATESNEILLMTLHKIEISNAKPSNFNKNSLQHEGQHTDQHHQQQQQQLLPQQRHYKHQNTIDNKHQPCDYVEHTSSIVNGSAAESNTNISNTVNTKNATNNNVRTTTTIASRQIDATANSYKPLIIPYTSNGVDTNNVSNKPLALLLTSTLSPSSTFNVARNGFRDKINISNQRNEFTSEVVAFVDNDITVESKSQSKSDFKVQVQVQKSTLETAEKYNNNLIIDLNSNYTTGVVNNYVVPATSSFFEHVELVESSLSTDKRHELLLHRRKRYLVFPEGSSFQLVFDLIIGIVDYTSYAILGITCSVAWELPSKPPSEIIENFRDKLNEGTFGLQRRNDSIADKELQYVETQSKNPTRLTATTTTVAPTHYPNFSYENAWKPQKYVDTTNYYREKYISKMVTATPTAPSYYGNYDESVAAPDMTGGAVLAEAQRKTLNDKAATTTTTATAQWYSHWNRPNADKAYDKNWSTKKNYEWRGNDKWKYAPYVASADWHRRGMSNSGSSGSDYHDGHDDYNADSVNSDERQQERERLYKNWRQKDNWWQHYTNQHWRDKQQKWAEFEAQRGNWNSYTPKKPVTIYATPMNPDGNQNYARTARQRILLKQPPKHRIYPIFGRKKRSRRSPKPDAESTAFELKLDRIHFREQLKSRQKLYGKIEQLFQTRGHNGTACVLRALCETGQRHYQLPLHHRQHGHRDHHQQDLPTPPHMTTGQQHGPQSFITELLRAIFALPKDIRNREYVNEYDNESQAMHSHAGHPSTASSYTGYGANDTPFEYLQREFEAQIPWHYRDAHAYAGNCAERFASCEHSIWHDETRHSGVLAPTFKM